MRIKLHKIRKLLLLMMICSIQLNAYSQDIASAAIMEKSVNRSFEETSLKSLKHVLTELEDLYHVHFNFASNLVQNQVVNKEIERKILKGNVPSEAFEESLASFLKPFNLQFKKVDKMIYGIYSLEKSVPVLMQSPSSSIKEEKVFATLKEQMKESFQKRNEGKRPAQDITVKGKVTSTEDNNPLPGVSVLIKGTTQGTVTDLDGNYTINSTEDGVLVFSFIGFTTEEIPVNGRSTINVSLTGDVKSLEEVVVTALGIKKESKRLGYSTATVAPEQINVNRTANFMNALQGKMAGVNITQLGSGPAGTSKIRIRGQSSVTGQNNPLIVVNGVPINNDNFGVATRNAGSDGATKSRGANNQSDGGDGLSSINPDDIESMTVLKGAAASALYGSRAKDGVIMITTKTRGTQSGIGVEYNSNFTSDTPLDFTDYQYEYGQGENGKRPIAANPTSGVWSFGEKFQPGMTQVLFDGVEVPYEPVHDRIKKFYRTGHTWTNTITLSSGGENGGFSLSLSNMDNTSIMPNSKFNRKTVNLGFTQKLGQKLSVTGNVNYSNEKNTNPPQIAEQDLSTPTTIYSLANSMPFDLLREKMVNADGNEYVYSRFTNRTNPYFAAYKRFDNIERDRVFGNITARYNFTDWIYVQGRVGQDYFSRGQEYNFPTGAASLGAPPSGFVNGTYIQEKRSFRELNTDFLVGANKTFGLIGIDLTLGGNQMYRRRDNNSVLVQDFVIRDLYTVMNGRLKDPIYELDERKVNSLYGAAEFSYKEFLYLNLTARNDWFSTLSPANRSIMYPSITGSFVFSQAFVNLPDWITFGKIRAGYAEVGDDGSVAPYSNQLYYRVNNNLFANPSGNPQPVGLINGETIPNPDLKPMRVAESEVGLELKLFNDRVGVDVTYYNKLTTDQILNAQVSDASGYTGKLINVGESRNKGVEMLLNLVPVQLPNFKWNVTLNGSYNTSKVLKLGENDTDKEIIVGRGVFEGELRQVVGEPIGQLYGYGYLRDDQGRQVFDANNGRPLRTPTQISFGSAIPVHVGGIFNSFTYKGINLSFLVDFKLGHKMISATNFNAWRHGLHKETLVGREQGYVVGNGVNPNGEINTVQTPVQAFYETVRSSNLMEPIVYDAGFWKLRQITIGYDFTPLLGSTSIIKSLRLNAVANNVAILKKWVPNIDPEQFGFSSDNLIGLEAPGLPTTRSIGFNLNAKF